MDRKVYIRNVKLVKKYFGLETDGQSLNRM